MSRNAVTTPKAPAPIGPYSQAVRAGPLIYCSGQIPLDPESGAMVTGDFATQARQVLRNLCLLAEACGPGPEAIVKINVYLTDLGNGPLLNELMQEFFQPPYPARATLGVAALPKNATIEMDAVLLAAAPPPAGPKATHES